MRHRKKKKILDRNASGRRALIRNLACELIIHRRIKTTHTKAKVLRAYIEKLITKSRSGQPSSLRYLQKYLNKKTANILFKNIAPKYKKRDGGYTRVVKIGRRSGDNALMALIEFV
ncbi:MAG: 50S ribosomal protein L17 [Patescibacteria group bacterium]|nr:50S ribosomal protein L17 [Patescibacteria group bacterium]